MRRGERETRGGSELAAEKAGVWGVRAGAPGSGPVQGGPGLRMLVCVGVLGLGGKAGFLRGSSLS